MVRALSSRHDWDDSKRHPAQELGSAHICRGRRLHVNVNEFLYTDRCMAGLYESCKKDLRQDLL
eukprot:COSAG05_NODE_1070_length_5967_cov_444.629857_8_plen_64_part_00